MRPHSIHLATLRSSSADNASTALAETKARTRSTRGSLEGSFASFRRLARALIRNAIASAMWSSHAFDRSARGRLGMRQAGELSEHSNESIESLSMSVTRFHGHAKATIGMSPPFWRSVESCNDFVGRRELGELGGR